MSQNIVIKFLRVVEIDVRLGMKQIEIEVPLVVGDTGLILNFNCINYFDNRPVNLDNKSVYFSMKLSGQHSVSTSKKLCTITDPAVSGMAQYQFASGDLLYPGTYFGDLVIVDGPIVETAPEAVRFIVRERNE